MFSFILFVILCCSFLATSPLLAIALLIAPRSKVRPLPNPAWARKWRRRRSLWRVGRTIPGLCYLRLFPRYIYSSRVDSSGSRVPTRTPCRARLLAFRSLGFFPKREALLAFIASSPWPKLADSLRPTGRDPRLGHLSPPTLFSTFFPSPLRHSRYGLDHEHPADYFYESPHRNSALAFVFSDFKKFVDRQRTDAPFHVPRPLLHLLDVVGINRPPAFATAHPHPAHVALERRSIAAVRPLLRPNQWYSLFLRPQKVANNSLPPPLGQYCPELTGKDALRYAGHSTSPVSLPPRSVAPVWFAHDTLHHLSPAEVGSWFDNNSQLQCLAATLVVPPETLFKLSPALPHLYKFWIDGSRLTYIPEGDNGGRYEQPLSAKDWLTAHSLVTPDGLHLSVELVHSAYAHHVLLIRRAPSYNDARRTFDIRGIRVVPWWIMPFSTPAQRTTSQRLIDKLQMYAQSLPATSRADLYAKVRQYAFDPENQTPAWFVHPAVLYVYYNQLVQFSAAGSAPTALFLAFTALTRLPFLPLAWVLQSLTASPFVWSATSAQHFSLPTRYLVSSPIDARLPYHHGATFPKPALPLFYLAPSATILERVANLNARFCSWLLLKALIAEPVVFAYHHSAAIQHALDRLIYIIDWSPQRALLSAVVFVVSYFLDFLPTSPWDGIAQVAASLNLPVPTLAACTSWMISRLFVLPTARLPLRVGGSYPYQVLLFVQCILAAFPRAGPHWMLITNWPSTLFPRPHNSPVSLLDIAPRADRETPSSHRPVLALLLLLVIGSLLVSIWCRWTRPRPSRPILPHHGSPDYPGLGYGTFLRSQTARTQASGQRAAALLATRIGSAARTIDESTAYPRFFFLHHWRQRRTYYEGLRKTLKHFFSSGPQTRSGVRYSLSDARLIAELDLHVTRQIHYRPELLDYYPTFYHPCPPPPPTRLPPPRPETPEPEPTLPLPPRPRGPPAVPPRPLAPTVSAPPFPPLPPASAPPLPSSPRPLPALPPPVPAPVAPTPGPQAAPYPVPPPPPPARINADPLAMFRVTPDRTLDPHHFVDIIRTLPQPPFRPDPARMCVWDGLARQFFVNPNVLWAIFLAHLPAGARAPFILGPVHEVDLARVYNFFACSVQCFHGIVDPNLGAPTIRPTEQPFLVTTGGAGWPTFDVVIADTPQGLHAWTGPVARAGGAAPPARLPGLVAFSSRIVPADQIAALLNIPMAFKLTYERLAGMSRNAAALASQRFGFPASRAAPLPPFQPLPRIPARAEVIQYTPTRADKEAAMALARDIKARPAVLECHERNAYNAAQDLDSAAKTWTPSPVEIVLINGNAGTAKSHLLRTLIPIWRAEPGFRIENFRVHTWFIRLRESVAKDLGPYLPGHKDSNFFSMARPLYEPSAGTVVFDDASLLWPGFVQLFLAYNPAVTRVVFTFDTTQARTPFPVADAASLSLPPTVEWLTSLSTTYATDQKRLSLDNSELFGLPPPTPVPGYAPTNGNLYVVSKPPPGVPLLVTSPRFATSKRSDSTRCITLAECQGMTIDGDIAIDAGGLTDSVGDNLIWPALTRARNNIFIVIGPGATPPKLRVEPSYGCSTILSTILAVSAHSETALLTPAADPDRLIARAVHNHLARSLSPTARALLGLTQPSAGVAASSWNPADWAPLDFLRPLATRRFEEAAALASRRRTKQRRKRANRRLRRALTPAHPAFSALPLPTPGPAETNRHAKIAHLLRHDFPVSADTILSASPSRDSVPRQPSDPGVPDPVHLHFDVGSPEERERAHPRSIEKTAQFPEHGALLAPHHRARDRATELMGISKRLRVGQDSPRLTTADRQRLGQLKAGARKFFDIKQFPFNEAYFQRALTEALRSWASKKTVADIARSKANSPDDMPVNFIPIFPKSQDVKKLSAAFGPAKASQIVATFTKERIFRDSVWACYVGYVIADWRRETTYLHDKPITDLREWYSHHWRPGPITANDYTSWDSGCDHVFTAFDCWIFEMAGVPRQYIDEYRWLKLNSTTYLGPLRSMQFSGDRFTWLFNTVRNAALTGASLGCPTSTPAVFSGDDSAVLGAHRRARGFVPRSWLMVPKTSVSSSEEFCGFTLGGPTLHVDPAAVLHRGIIALQDGRAEASYWDSYDLSLRYSVSDEPSSLLSTAAQLSAHARSVFRLPPTPYPFA